MQEGSVQVFGEELKGASRSARLKLRRRIGMIIQGHNLLRCLTAEQNVQMGADLLQGLSYRARRDRSREWLRAVGLSDHLSKLPHDLSGGQKQRVSIARALAARPQLLLADEPTASLDSRTGREVVELLKGLAKDQGCGVLMVTHDPRILDVADRLVQMEDGQLSKGAFAIEYGGISHLSNTPLAWLSAGISRRKSKSEIAPTRANSRSASCVMTAAVKAPAMV